jgi:hypothetical protein
MKAFIAGLPADERAELLGNQPAQTQPPAAQPPPMAPPATTVTTAAQPPATTAIPAHMAAQSAQLAPEVQAILDRAINAECETFLGSVARKVSPAERTGIIATYKALAAMNDGGNTLATFKASVVARPDNPMLRDIVPVNGQLRVAPNGQSETGAPTAQEDAALVNKLLSQSDVGQQAAQALATGKIRPDYEQFAVEPVGVFSGETYR